MKQSNTSKYAYLAGLVDGEGCIRVNKTENDRLNPSFSVRLQIAQKNGKLIDWLYGNFGGSVYKQVPKRTKHIRPNGEIYEAIHYDYRWSIQEREKTLELLKKILPFSIEKKSQIQAGIEMINFLIQYSKTMNRGGFGLLHRPENLEHYKTTCEKYYWKLRELKKIQTPCAAVETKFGESSKEDKR